MHASELVKEDRPKSARNTSTDAHPALAFSIDAKNGFLVKPGSVEDLVKKLVPLIDDESLRGALSERAFRDFDHSFSEDAMIRDLENLYGELTGDRATYWVRGGADVTSFAPVAWEAERDGVLSLRGRAFDAELGPGPEEIALAGAGPPVAVVAGVAVISDRAP